MSAITDAARDAIAVSICGDAGDREARIDAGYALAAKVDGRTIAQRLEDGETAERVLAILCQHVADNSGRWPEFTQADNRWLDDFLERQTVENR